MRRRGEPTSGGVSGVTPSGRGLPTSSPSANPVGGIGGILATAGSTPRTLLPLTLTAIGVVYGDIGTSPLYAMRECFFGSHAVPPTHANVLGVLSLIIYSLLLVISIKYIAVVMRADNQGEGGILALTALLPSRPGNGARWPMLVLMGIFGAALLYGDGMITPAITVLGAVEGLEAQPRGTPSALAHNLRYNKVLHQHVVTLMVTTQPVPHVPVNQQTTVRRLGHGVFDVVIRYGFMDDPNIPRALARARDGGLELDEEDVTYFLGRETLIVTRAPGMAMWREQLFVFMARNAVRATAFFRLPPERVVELGVQVEIQP